MNSMMSMWVLIIMRIMVNVVMAVVTIITNMWVVMMRILSPGIQARSPLLSGGQLRLPEARPMIINGKNNDQS